MVSDDMNMTNWSRYIQQHGFLVRKIHFGNNNIAIVKSVIQNCPELVCIRIDECCGVHRVAMAEFLPLFHTNVSAVAIVRYEIAHTDLLAIINASPHIKYLQLPRIPLVNDIDTSEARNPVKLLSLHSLDLSYNLLGEGKLSFLTSLYRHDALEVIDIHSCTMAVENVYNRLLINCTNLHTLSVTLRDDMYVLHINRSILQRIRTLILHSDYDSVDWYVRNVEFMLNLCRNVEHVMIDMCGDIDGVEEWDFKFSRKGFLPKLRVLTVATEKQNWSHFSFEMLHKCRPHLKTLLTEDFQFALFCV